MALTFDLAAIPLKYVAFPVVVGLAAGTGAIAAYVTTPSAPVAREKLAAVAALPAAPMAPAPAVVTTEQIAPAKPAKKLSCEEQTWPYIDNRCIARKRDKGAEPARSVRVVTTARDAAGGVANSNGPKLITSDGVLRGPGVAPEVDGAKAKPQTPTVKKAKRADRRQGRDQVRSVYSVPSGDSIRPVIVVRPLRIEQYSSRY